MTAVWSFCAISARACAHTTGSWSTYTTRAPVWPFLGDLMHIRAARQPAANVEELADPGIAQEPDRTRKELPITAHGVQDLRHHREYLIASGPVGGVVVLATQPVVIHPGRVRDVHRNRILGQTRSAVAILGTYFLFRAVVEERTMVKLLPAAYPPYRRATKMLIPYVL